ncbi:VOC family protein [Undibacterium oligocarboniphilum]|uniref:Diguanylate cyclase n=1 Tax=Undibacterium oligocarboniphilum TaxID=666702 RepID=A0A850QDM2_9BURK|nr:VOC family protein [Undibacterium oligocarboniphilum]MBC3870646.1 diguanylate cyclase [Undibacterium oligocarboniphilum]NVO78552.1 diguanylate cyclase [Undibacterium oligocarboniphilum]
MAAVSIDHYNLRSDRAMMAVLRDFYCRYVGLQNGPRAALNSFGYWLYAGAQPVLHLSELRPGEARQTAQPTTFDHVAFECADFEQMLSVLQQDGIAYRLSEIPPSDGFVHQRQIFLKDPAGNGIELNFHTPS